MTQLMQGKRGLIMGVANDHSIAWGIARTLAAHGATLAFSYQGEALGRRVKPLADSVGASLLLSCDVGRQHPKIWLARSRTKRIVKPDQLPPAVREVLLRH